MGCKKCGGLGLDHYGYGCAYCEEGERIENNRFKREYKTKKPLEYMREINRLD